VLCDVVRLDAVAVVPHEAVLRLPLAGQVAAGEVDHALRVVAVVVAHGLDAKPGAAGVQSREQFLARIFDAAAVRHAVLGVVIIHQLEGCGHGARRVAVADRREEQREVAGAVGEDAQVAVQLAPQEAQAVAPGEDLAERVVR
jgi:hypothetical protein